MKRTYGMEVANYGQLSQKWENDSKGIDAGERPASSVPVLALKLHTLENPCLHSTKKKRVWKMESACFVVKPSLRSLQSLFYASQSKFIFIV